MLTVLALLLVGTVVGYRGWLPAGAGPVLDAVVVRVAFPGLILALAPQLELHTTAFIPVAAAWGAVALLAVLVLVVARVGGLDRRTTGTLLLLVPLGNTSFLGFPAVEALLGPAHLPGAVLYDQLGSFLALATYGTFVAARYGGAEPPSGRALVRRVLVFPPFVALVLGIGASATVGVPDPVVEVAGRIGAMVTPLAMLAVGLRLRLDVRGARPALLAVGLVLSLVVAPLAVYGVATAIGASGTLWEVSVLEAAMPPMVIAAVVAADADLDAGLASRLVGIGVLAAMATLPVWAAIVS